MSKYLIFLFALFIIACSETSHSVNESEADTTSALLSGETITSVNEDTSTQTQIDEDLFFIELENPEFDESKQISTLLEQPVSSNQLSGVLSEKIVYGVRDNIDQLLEMREFVQIRDTEISAVRTYDNENIETLEIINNCVDGGTTYIKRVGKTFYEIIASDCVAFGNTFNFHAIDYVDDKTIMTFNVTSTSNNQSVFKGNYVLTDNAEQSDQNQYEIFVEYNGTVNATYFASGQVNYHQSYSIYGALDTYSHYKYNYVPNSIAPCRIEKIGVLETINIYSEEILEVDDRCLNPDNFVELPWDNPGETLVYELTIEPSDNPSYYDPIILFYLRDAKIEDGNELIIAIANNDQIIEYIGYSPSKHDFASFDIRNFNYIFNAQLFYNNQTESKTYYLYLNNFNTVWNSELSNSILVDYGEAFNNRLTFKKIGTIANGNFISPYSEQTAVGLNDSANVESINISEPGYYFIRLKHDYPKEAFGTTFNLFNDEQKIIPILIEDNGNSSNNYNADSSLGAIYASYYLEPGTYNFEATFRNWFLGNNILNVPEVEYSILIEKFEFDTNNIMLE